ncbi:hypothetical protein IDJ77_11290 [Mucilaginibacter sp. ZT4R22]|uniref:Uncharacterized protein n=1 Tax=Mucilaginibacter pankratovii TaxID=2772110 RepID=A0ABR7WPY7_9SPHI|nr:hypothetical protein [Mucilaginibacter pankratovii]MBD1364393.1 hypothetical protein [Mucilaginibacter pankratovii]
MEDKNKMSDKEIAGLLGGILENDIDLPKNYPGYPTFPGTTTVNTDDLQKLIAQCEEYKADIITLVSTFNGLEALFSGGGGLMSIIPVVTNLIKDPERMKQIAAIVPVMNKYKSQPNENDS